MLKKSCFLAILLAIILAINVPAFAGGGDEISGAGGVRDAATGIIGKEPEGTTTQSTTTQESAARVQSDPVGLDKIISDKYIDPTGQFLVTITRPEGDENTFENTYPICGLTSEKGVIIQLAKYNEATGAYEELNTTDGQSSWDVDEGNEDVPKDSDGVRVFSRLIDLQMGANKIKIIAYKKSDTDNLKVGVNVQVNTFTVTLLEAEKKDGIVDNTLTLKSMMDNALTIKN